MYLRFSRTGGAECCFGLGIVALVAAVLGGYTYGIAVAAFVPVPFTLAAALDRSRWRIGLALAVWCAWLMGLGFVLA